MSIPLLLKLAKASRRFL